MPKVLIIQRVLPHYRVEFFSRLHLRLSKQGIEMKLLYGQHEEGTVPTTCLIDQPWAEFVPNKYSTLCGVELVHQQVTIETLNNTDLIIVEQASRLLLNYKILLWRFRYKYKVAYWGHGRNYQAKHQKGVAEKLKRLQVGFADYWFAYTHKTKAFLEEVGVRPSLITVVNNTIDSQPLHEEIQAIEPSALETLRRELDIKEGSVAIFCGGMDEKKRLPFLLEAIVGIKAKLPDFQMIFIGDGPYASLVADFCSQNSWSHYIGKVTSVERAKYFALSQLMLMPGALGLVIIDSLVTGTPIVTTSLDSHNPEVVYLEHGRNSIFSPDDLEKYICAVTETISDRDKVQCLQRNCLADAPKYSLDAMVENFSSGVLAAIKIVD